jgi:hypothetical protein
MERGYEDAQQWAVVQGLAPGESQGAGGEGCGGTQQQGSAGSRSGSASGAGGEEVAEGGMVGARVAGGVVLGSMAGRSGVRERLMTAVQEVTGGMQQWPPVV